MFINPSCTKVGRIILFLSAGPGLASTPAMSNSVAMNDVLNERDSFGRKGGPCSTRRHVTSMCLSDGLIIDCRVHNPGSVYTHPRAAGDTEFR